MTPLYRAAAADALGRIGATEATPVFLKIVNDFDNAMDVRHAAARALGRTAAPNRLPQLTELAESYPEVATQRALWGACAAVRARSDDVTR
jgi:HEAT repeat protein